MSSTNVPHGITESFACGHAAAPRISNEIITQHVLADYLANSEDNFEPMQIFTMGPCPLAVCQARAGDGYDHTVEKAQYGLAEVSHYDALYGAIQFCWTRWVKATDRLDQLYNLTVRTVQCLYLPEVSALIHFLDEDNEGNEEGELGVYDLSPVLGPRGFNHFGVMLTRMETAMKTNEPIVLFRACATQAEALLERICGKMTDLEALVEKLEQVEAVLIASGLDQESEWTEEDQRNLENGNVPAKCGDNIEREKIAMKIFRPDVTRWDQVALPVLTVRNRSICVSGEAVVSTILSAPSTQPRGYGTPPWRKHQELSPLWPWTASLDRLFSVSRERSAPEYLLISPTGVVTMYDEIVQECDDEYARKHRAARSHMGFTSEAATVAGAKDFDHFEF